MALNLKTVADVIKLLKDGGTKLDLTDKNIGDAGARIVAAALQQCKDLTSLELWNNGIGVDGARALAGGLSQWRTLKSLSLSKNNIRADGVRALVAVLPQCKDLKLLFLGDNSIGVEGVRLLVDVLPQCPTLERLSLHDNNMGDDGVLALAAALPQCPALRDLKLGSNSISAVGVNYLAGALMQCPALEQLGLDGNYIGDDGVRALASALHKCFALQYLEYTLRESRKLRILSRTGLSANGVRAISSVLTNDGTRPGIFAMLDHRRFDTKISDNEYYVVQQLEAELAKNKLPDRVQQAATNLAKAKAEYAAKRAAEARAKQEALAAALKKSRATPPVSWTTDGVAAWIDSAGLRHLEKYFRDGRIDGETLVALTPDDYADLGITSDNDKKRLQAKLGKLLAQTANGTQPPAQGSQSDELSVDEVAAWLAATGLTHLVASFRSNGIAGDDLTALTPADYERLGVQALGDKKKLQSKQAELRGRGGTLPVTASTPATASALPAETSSDDWALSRHDITLTKELGRGSFGAAYLALFNGAKVAAKEALGDLTDAKRAEARAEAALMKRVCNPPNPNVLLFYGAVIDTRGILIVTELCDLGCLHPYLLARPNLDGVVRLQICTQIARGMRHLHELKPPVLHRDLAARNVLLATRDGAVTAKVSDFGLSRSMPREETHYEVLKSPIPIRWSAPEVLSAREFYPASDVWAFGVTAWEVYANGALPYPDVTIGDVMDGVPYKKLFLSQPAACPAPVWAILKTCLAYMAHDRPKFRELATQLTGLLPKDN